MNWGSWLLWGFVATVVLTAILGGSQGLGMTRMNIPYLLGTMFYVIGASSRMVAAALNCFIGGLTVVFAYRTARVLFSEAVAVRR